MSYNYIKKPNVKKPYTSLKYSDEDIAKEKRREERAKKLGMNLYILDDEKSINLVKFENYILESFLDKDEDVPEDVIEEYFSLKDKIVREVISN